MSILDKIKDVFKGETPEQKLRKAIEKGDAKKVDALLDAGVNPFVFFEDSEGITTPRLLAEFYSEQSPLDEDRANILTSIANKRLGMINKHGVRNSISDYMDIEGVIEHAGRPLTKKEISRGLNAERAARAEKEKKQDAEQWARLEAEVFGIDKVYSKEVIREATLAEKNNVQGQALRKKLAKQLQEVRKKHGHKARSVAREDAKINETRKQLDRHLLNRIAGER